LTDAASEESRGGCAVLRLREGPCAEARAWLRDSIAKGLAIRLGINGGDAPWNQRRRRALESAAATHLARPTAALTRMAGRCVARFQSA